MPTYSIDLKLPNSNIEELIEHLRTIGAAETVQFTIEAPTRRKAVREITDLLSEFAATYRGEDLSSDAADGISEELKLSSERAGVDF